jgi:alpha-L-fucosidase
MSIQRRFTVQTPVPLKDRNGEGTPPKNNLVYAHVFDWPVDGLLNIPELTDTGKAWLLSDADRSTVTVTSSNGGISLQLPETAPDSIATVIAIEM